MNEQGQLRIVVAVISCAVTVRAAETDDVRIETIKVAGAVYMLIGRGGNLGLCVGEDGAFLIDDQFAPLTEKITAAVAAVSAKPIRFVINTHWHSDHTGGNENLGTAGAIIVAHENVRTRLGTEQFMEAFNRKVPASPPAALPVITFADSVTFHLNGDEIHVFHVAPAHTDGDSMIHFRKANVLHMGDTYFNGNYPFIDVSSRGSIDGVIAAVDRALALTDDHTRIIPGHGQLSGVAELKSYRDMLETLRGRIRALADAGKTREEAAAAKPTEEFDAQWGRGFMKPDQWVSIVYDSLAAR